MCLVTNLFDELNNFMTDELTDNELFQEFLTEIIRNATLKFFNNKNMSISEEQEKEFVERAVSTFYSKGMF